jgi:hypothetical protein
MFKLGDKIICISDKIAWITYGKEYTVFNINEFDNRIWIVDDRRDCKWYSVGWFKKAEDKNMNTFTKSMLKTGMSVKFRDRDYKMMVIVGDTETYFYGTQSLILVDNNGFILGDSINDDLTSMEFSEFDIVEVYDTKITGLKTLLSKIDDAPVLWTRRSDKEIKIEKLKSEIEKLHKEIQLLESEK